jgi:tRNA(Ile)-lysidine synthase
VAVSGGADSVALLHVLLELREELGIVLSVAHFNHQIRGEAADADERFVAHLAQQHQLDFHSGRGDAPALAAQKKQSLETAARDLRYEFFRRLIREKEINKIALAHTMDDQAETVLMRLLRGAGTRGLAGIYPQRSEDNVIFIRPLLEIRRADIEAFLQNRKQSWQEDATNADPAHTRNKLRHELLPKLREFNPAIVETLARSAEVARAEEDYWRAEADRLLPLLILPGKATRGGGRSVETASAQSFGLDLHVLAKHPLALQRRLIRAAAASLNPAAASFNIDLDVEHVESILQVARGEAKAAELPGYWRVVRSHRELRFEPQVPPNKSATTGYDYPAPIPGQVSIPDVNLLVHLHLKPLAKQDAAYNLQALQPDGLFCAEAGHLRPLVSAATLRVRNWHEGDRFRQAHSASEKKVKDLLQEMKVPRELRRSWPVVSSGEKVIWVKGTRALPLWFADQRGLQRLLIEAQEAVAD